MLNKESKETEALEKQVEEAYKQLWHEREYAYGSKVSYKGKGWAEAIQHYDNIGHNLLVVKKIIDDLLTELQQIKSAEPKEALKSLKSLKIFINTEDELFDYEDFEMVEQALIQGEQNRIKINNLLSYLEDEEVAIMGITNIDKYPNMKAELKLIKKIKEILGVKEIE